MLSKILEKSYRQKVLVRLPRGLGPPQPGAVPLLSAGELGRLGQPGAAPAQGCVLSSGDEARQGTRGSRSRWGSGLVMVTGPSHSLEVARPGHGEEAGPRSMVGLGQQGWWPGCDAATMEFRWGLGGASAWHWARRTGMGAPSKALGAAREAGGCPGQLRAPGVDLYASAPPN